MSYPVSVCIIAKNEEKHIEECLKHLLPYDMEIIVVDTGSTDKTKEIAIKYTNNVFDFTWIDDFSAARNFCAGKATNNWILVIDCDEYVEKINTKSLRMYMQKYPKIAGKIRLRNIARRNNGETGYVNEDIIRFYNKNFYEFAYPVHESIVSKRNADERLDCFLTPIEVIHHGYNIGAEEMKKKQLRNLTLLYQALETNDSRNAYTCFQIGQSEQVLGNIETAIEYYHKCLELNDDMQLSYMNTCVVQLATAFAQNDEPQKALAVMESYKDKLKNARFVYTYALALLGTEDFLKALVQFVLASTMSDRESLGEDLMYCYQYIIKLYTMFGEEKMADDFRQRYEDCQKERERLLINL